MWNARAQAFTLEGVIGSAIVLTALFFAVQSVVVAPTTGGTVDQSERLSLQRQADDALTVVAHRDSEDLSYLVRYWSSDQGTFAGASSRTNGYGSDQPPGPLGVILSKGVADGERQYNLVMRYQTGGGYESVPIVDRGEPADNAVLATYRVTLYDDQTLTAPGASPNLPLTAYGTSFGDDPGFYPVPDAVSGPVYNVVEVRLVVW